MYLRGVYAEGDVPPLLNFIRANPLGLFTTGIPSSSYNFLQTSHIPWVTDLPTQPLEADPSSPALGVLRGHMARANPQARAIIEHLHALYAGDAAGRTTHTLSADVMVLFNGPSHHYITPKFYSETKPTTGKVVPTWNYSAVQVYGRATVFVDGKSPETNEFLDKQIRDLSMLSEKEIMRYEEAWQVEDAPTNYIEALKKAIIGIEIQITDIGGKWKMSQEVGSADRAGVIGGLEKLGTKDARVMAESVRERGALLDANRHLSKIRLQVSGQGQSHAHQDG